MDNLTHSLVGAALARTRLGRLSPAAGAILVTGANLPDLDVVVRLWGGRAGYLEHHRGVTHGAPGVLVQGLLLGLVAALLLRARARRRGERPPGLRGPLTLALVALATHPLLDLLNVYGLRPWLPFDARWVYGDVLFILDPWLWLALGAVVLLGGERSRRAGLVWGALLGLGALVVAAAARQGRVASGPAVLWGAGLAAVLAARALDLGRGRASAIARAGWAAAGLYVAALFALGPPAARRGREAAEARLRPGEEVLSVVHAPSPMDPRRWGVTVETRAALVQVDVHLGGRVDEPRRVERGLDDARVAAALDADCSAAFRAFARLPVAALREGPDGARVELYDLRYQPETTLDDEGEGTWCSVVLEVAPDGSARCP